jgi:hypothetical protein
MRLACLILSLQSHSIAAYRHFNPSELTSLTHAEPNSVDAQFLAFSGVLDMSRPASLNNTQITSTIASRHIGVLSAAVYAQFRNYTYVTESMETGNITGPRGRDNVGRSNESQKEIGEHLSIIEARAEDHLRDVSGGSATYKVPSQLDQEGFEQITGYLGSSWAQQDQIDRRKRPIAAGDPIVHYTATLDPRIQSRAKDIENQLVALVGRNQVSRKTTSSQNEHVWKVSVSGFHNVARLEGFFATSDLRLESCSASQPFEDESSSRSHRSSIVHREQARAYVAVAKMPGTEKDRQISETRKFLEDQLPSGSRIFNDIQDSTYLSPRDVACHFWSNRIDADTLLNELC